MRSHLRRLVPSSSWPRWSSVSSQQSPRPTTTRAARRSPQPSTTRLTLTNARRTAHGLVKLRLDSRLVELARDRAQYMADTGRFSHTQSNGTDVFDMIEPPGIRWYAAGEIIAWNTAGPARLLGGVRRPGLDGLGGAQGHRPVGRLQLRRVRPGDRHDGTRYWAGVYLRGPDRTGGWSRRPADSARSTGRDWARGTVRWSGGDTRLQVLTAGHRYFQVQWRVAGGAWQSIGTTTATKVTKWWLPRLDLRGPHPRARPQRQLGFVGDQDVKP